MIGIHKGTPRDTKFEFNYGIFIKKAINLFNQKSNKNNYINNEVKYNINEKYNNNQQENKNMNDMNQGKNSCGIKQINNFENNMTLENYSTLSRLIK